MRSMGIPLIPNPKPPAPNPRNLMFLDGLKSLLQDPPPAMAFEISEAGIAAARIGARAELEFQPLRAGVVTVSPLKENIHDTDEFSEAVRVLAAPQASR